MQDRMHARDVMTTKLITIGETATVQEAARLMSENHVGALPLLDEQGRLVGLLSEADLLHRQEIGTQVIRPWWLEAVTPASTLAAEFVQARGTAAGELMSREVVSAAPSAPLSEIAALMERHRVKRIPIVEDGRLVGVVSRANLVQGLASVPTHVGETVAQDRVIRATALAPRRAALDRLRRQERHRLGGGRASMGPRGFTGRTRGACRAGRRSSGGEARR
jgi:CBS domain-containing protein